MKERVEWIAMMYKQNLNGRETEGELFEAGILAGIEETEALMYSDEDLKGAYESGRKAEYNFQNKYIQRVSFQEWFEQFKKK